MENREVNEMYNDPHIIEIESDEPDDIEIDNEPCVIEIAGDEPDVIEIVRDEPYFIEASSDEPIIEINSDESEINRDGVIEIDSDVAEALEFDNGIDFENWCIVESDKSSDEIEFLESYDELGSDSENDDYVTDNSRDGLDSSYSDKDDCYDMNQHGDGNKLVDIFSKTKRTYKSLNANGLRLELKFRKPGISDITKWLELCIAELFSIMEEELEINPQDRVGLIFNNTNNARADFSFCQVFA